MKTVVSGGAGISWRDAIAFLVASVACSAIYVSGGSHGKGETQLPVLDSGSVVESQEQQMAVMVKNDLTVREEETDSVINEKVVVAVEESLCEPAPEEPDPLKKADDSLPDNKEPRNVAAITLEEVEQVTPKDVEKMTPEEIERTVSDYRQAFEAGRIEIRLVLSRLSTYDVQRISKGFVLTTYGHVYQVSSNGKEVRKIDKLSPGEFKGDIPVKCWPEHLRSIACAYFGSNHNATGALLVDSRYQVQIYRFIRERNPEDGSQITISVSSDGSLAPHMELLSIEKMASGCHKNGKKA